MSETQRELALRLLRSLPAVCVSDVGPAVAYTLRNRVAELRASGFDIRSSRCRRHPHRASVAEYRLVENPAQTAMEWAS